MAARFIIIQYTVAESNPTYILTIDDASYVGVPHNIDSGSFTLKYKDVDYNDPLVPIIESSVEIAVDVTENDNDFESFLNEIVGADELRFTVSVERNNAAIWRGHLVCDLVEIPDASHPYTVSLTASCGLARLKNIPYDDNGTPYEGAATIAEHLVNIIKKIGLPASSPAMWSYGFHWIEQNAYVTEQGLDMVSLQHTVFQSYNEYPELECMMCYEALSEILRTFNCRIFAWGNSFLVSQINDTNNAMMAKWDSSGKAMPADFIDRQLDFTNLNRTDGNFSYVPALREATVDYAYKYSINHNNLLPPVMPISKEVPIGNYSGANNHFLINLRIRSDFEWTLQAPCFAVFKIGISVGTKSLSGKFSSFFGSTDPTWVDGLHYFNILTPYGQSNSSNITQFELITPAFDVTGPGKVWISFVGLYQTPDTTYPLASNFSFKVENFQILQLQGSTLGESGSLRYRAINKTSDGSTLNSSATTTLQDSIMGDGPSPNSVSRIQVWNGNAWVDSVAWKPSISGSLLPLTKLRLQETLALRKTSTKIFEFTLQTYCKPWNTLIRNDEEYLILGYNLDVENDSVNVVCMKLSIDRSNIVLLDEVASASSGGSGGSGGYGSSYKLPKATSSVLGGIRLGNSLVTDQEAITDIAPKHKAKSLGFSDTGQKKITLTFEDDSKFEAILDNYLPLNNDRSTSFQHVLESPAAPSAGFLKLYTKNDDFVYIKNADGFEGKISMDGHTHSYLPLDGSQGMLNTTLVTNLNAEFLGGKRAGEFSLLAHTHEQIIYNRAALLPEGTDLNNITAAGFYTGNYWLNAPFTTTWYYLTVETYFWGPDHCHQTLSSFWGDQIYTRTRNSEGWTQWKEIALVGHIHPELVNAADRTDWVLKNVETKVIGQLVWRAYGNHHTVFEASNGISPSSVPINSNSNPDLAWAPSYPCLMGWNGSQTFGVKVDTARYAETTNSLSGYAHSQFVKYIDQTWLGLYDANIFDLSNGSTVISGYQWSNAPSNDIGILKTDVYSKDWIAQEYIHLDTEDRYIRRRYNGNTWGQWYKLWHSGNFNPTGYAPAHDHPYLPLAGGTVTGETNITSTLNVDYLRIKKSTSGESAGIILEGGRPNMIYQINSAVGGFAFNTMGILGTGVNGVKKQIGAIGILGGGGDASNDIYAEYIYIGAQSTTSYDNATLKISGNNRVGICLNGYEGPTVELDVNGQIKSRAALGTMPLIVASTTMVTNLNAEYLGGKKASNFVPIDGTTLTGQLVSRTFTSGEDGGAFLIRERDLVGNTQTAWSYAPGISFQWGTMVKKLAMGSSGSLAWNNNKIWDSSNGGHESGLNADLLDGKHASSFLGYDYLSEKQLSDANTITGGVNFSHLISSAANRPFNTSDYSLFSLAYDTNWASQLALDWNNNELCFRNKNGVGWMPWRKVWHSGNFNPANYAEIGRIITDDISFIFSDLEVGKAISYTLDLKASYAYTIHSVVLATDTGTVSGVAIKINSTAVTSLSALTASTTTAETAATGANSVAAGNKVTLTATGFTGATTLMGKIVIKRTL